MSKHDHVEPAPCEHVLKHCAKCDVAYCEKCNKEWPAEKVEPDLQKMREWMEKREYERHPYSPPVIPQWPLAPPPRYPGVVYCSHQQHTGERG
jgi:hypothetical protein